MFSTWLLKSSLKSKMFYILWKKLCVSKRAPVFWTLLQLTFQLQSLGHEVPRIPHFGNGILIYSNLNYNSCSWKNSTRSMLQVSEKCLCNGVDSPINLKYCISKCECKYLIKYMIIHCLESTNLDPFSQKYQTFKFHFSCENSHLPYILRLHLINQVPH